MGEQRTGGLQQSVAACRLTHQVHASATQCSPAQAFLLSNQPSPAVFAAAGLVAAPASGLTEGAGAAATVGGCQSAGTAHSSGLKSGPPNTGGSGVAEAEELADAEAAAEPAGTAATGPPKGAGMGTEAPPGNVTAGPLAAAAVREAELVRSIEAACGSMARQVEGAHVF